MDLVGGIEKLFALVHAGFDGFFTGCPAGRTYFAVLVSELECLD